MTDYFTLPSSPCAIQVSGGKTSAYLFIRLVEQNDGLPKNAVAIFQNTGREMPETYEFLEKLSEYTGQKIHWIEAVVPTKGRYSWRECTPKTAFRNGEPFEALILRRNFLPNAHFRFCTEELKIRPSQSFLKNYFGERKWREILGIRADEANRIERIQTKKERVIFPLYEAGITNLHILDFWRKMPFTLDLPTASNGKTIGGNCDGCFLKSLGNWVWLARKHSERAGWWESMEEKITTSTGRVSPQRATFRENRSWKNIRQLADAMPQLDFDDEPARLCGAQIGGCFD